MRAIIGVTVVLSSLAACATARPPTESLAESMAAVRSAEELGAPRVPQAAAALKLAQDEVDRTRALMSDAQNGRARLMALRAASDADLAIALVREDQARRSAERAAERTSAAAQATPTP